MKTLISFISHIRLLDITALLCIFLAVFIIATGFYIAGKNDGRSETIESVEGIEVFPDGESYISYGGEIHEYINIGGIN